MQEKIIGTISNRSEYSMKYISVYKHPEGRTFEIESEEVRELIHQQDLIDYRTYIYDRDGNSTHDYHNETLMGAKKQMLSMFGVPIESWVGAEE